MTLQKKILCVLITGCLAFPACVKGWPRIDLTPADKRQIYSVIVGDADEAGLLVQQLKIEPVRLEFGRLLFYASTDQLNTMRSLGYALQRSAAPEVNYRVVEVRRGTARRTEQDLTRTGVLILNREPDFWVVRGSLGQLSALQSAGFRLRNLTGEPRPREVRIVVPRVEDIQRVNEMGIDILGVDPRQRPSSTQQHPTPQRFTIGAAAFDYQIDKLKELGFEVTVQPYPPRQQKEKQP
jgi:hypothetical protein